MDQVRAILIATVYHLYNVRNKIIHHKYISSQYSEEIDKSIRANMVMFNSVSNKRTWYLRNKM